MFPSCNPCTCGLWWKHVWPVRVVRIKTLFFVPVKPFEDKESQASSSWHRVYPAMESDASRSRIQVKVMSCKDLRAFNFFQKLSVYAIVSLVSDDPDKKLDQNQRQQQRTPADKEGDGNPEWNHAMEFNLIEGFHLNQLFLHFDLRSEGLVFGIGDKALGEVRVRLDDLIQPYSIGITRFVSYQVSSGDGKPNGILNFSYKAVVNEMGKIGETGCSSSPATENEITGFPILNQPTIPPPKLYPTLEMEDPSSPQQILYPYPSLGTVPTQHPPYYHPCYPPPPPPPGYHLPPPPPLLPPPPPPQYHQHPQHGSYLWGHSPYWGRFDS